MADAIFDNPRLAAIYDAFEAPREDLEHYLALAREYGAEQVIDLGCGTGVLARALAAAGCTVIGIDPARASLDIAEAAETSESLTATPSDSPTVEWRHGTSAQIPASDADLVTMTGNVAQVFLGVAELESVFADCARGLRTGGRLIFETRDPAARAWQAWAQTPARTLDIDGIGKVTQTFMLGQVDLPFVSFTHLYRFHETGDSIGSRSRLRFHSYGEITSALETAGFEVDEVRDVPDRPGREWVFIARRR
ncbi:MULTISPECIES: class I SAM-dependent methyltransferase [unclassified Brevibacterium]|uniref:class I SAM-dependent methyltransferase n=1 Tax=unclassified Brevibacterium TaxID=2614124 RepID=UPI001E388E67|nr:MULTISPECIES: class I SAM-dependent methyltransferase [unclassified Brevibacterium]MCD1284476.1 SAM-dependent methyltransferase [Brevibacterium sp. CCUG 69071]MDK8435905.1 class I SAM-dependent methyltransferase [Brevibacterium sp. H-BE7]